MSFSLSVYGVWEKEILIDNAKCPVFLLGDVLKRILQFAHQEEKDVDFFLMALS